MTSNMIFYDIPVISITIFDCFELKNITNVGTTNNILWVLIHKANYFLYVYIFVTLRSFYLCYVCLIIILKFLNVLMWVNNLTSSFRNSLKCKIIDLKNSQYFLWNNCNDCILTPVKFLNKLHILLATINYFSEQIIRKLKFF